MENRKLIVRRKVTTAPKLPTNDALGKNGRVAMRRAVAVSIRPITAVWAATAEPVLHAFVAKRTFEGASHSVVRGWR